MTRFASLRSMPGRAYVSGAAWWGIATWWAAETLRSSAGRGVALSAALVGSVAVATLAIGLVAALAPRVRRPRWAQVVEVLGGWAFVVVSVMLLSSTPPAGVPVLIAALVLAAAVLSRVGLIGLWAMATGAFPVAALGLPPSLGTTAGMPVLSVSLSLAAAASMLPLLFHALEIAQRRAASERRGVPAWVGQLASTTLILAVGIAVSLAVVGLVTREVRTDWLQAGYTRDGSRALTLARSLEARFPQGTLHASSELATALVQAAAFGESDVYLFERGRKGMRLIKGARQSQGQPPKVEAIDDLAALPVAERAALLDYVDSPFRFLQPSRAWLLRGPLPVGHALYLEQADAGAATTGMTTSPGGVPAYVKPQGFPIFRRERVILVLAPSQAAWWETLSGIRLLTGTQSLLFALLMLGVALPSGLLPLLVSRRMRVHELEARAAERERIERDAHDRLFNRLAGLAARLDMLRDDPSRIAQHVSHLAVDIRDSVRVLRHIVAETAEDPVPSQGSSVTPRVVEHIRALCATLSARHGVTMNVEVCGPVDEIAPEVAWDVQCIVEEAVTNAVKHGSPSVISIVVSVSDDGAIDVLVSDDGGGIRDPERFEHRTGRGVDNMCRRAQNHHGTCDIEQSGLGVVVHARLCPLDQSA